MKTTVAHEGPIPDAKTLGHMRIRDRKFPLAHRLAAYAIRGSAAAMAGRCGSRLAFAPDFPEDTPPRYCMKAPVRHGTTCRLHNGTPLRGPAHGNYRTGEYSDLMQEGSALWKGYHRTRTDADLLSLTEQLRYLDALYRQLVEQSIAANGAGTEAWAAVVKGVADTVAAARSKDMEGMARGLGELEKLVMPAAAELSLRAEVLQVADARRRMVETQARLLEKGQHMVPIDQAVRYGALIAQSAVNAMLRGKTLRDALTLFQQDLTALEQGRVVEEAQQLPAGELPIDKG